MCQKYIINHGFCHREITVFKCIDPLLHTVIHKDMLSTGIQVMTASRNLMVGTNKYKLHPHYLLLISYNKVYHI